MNSWVIVIFVNILEPVQAPGILQMDDKFPSEQSCKQHVALMTPDTIDELLKELFGLRVKYSDVHLNCKQLKLGTPI